MTKLGPALVLVAGLAASGCGGGPGCVPVSGTVTVDGKPPPGPGYIYFNATSPAGTPTRPGTAPFDADGRYTVTSFEPGDGLLPGGYALRVDCWKTPPNMDGKPVVSFLPKRFENAEASGLTLTVPAGSKPITFDIPLTTAGK